MRRGKQVSAGRQNQRKTDDSPMNLNDSIVCGEDILTKYEDVQLRPILNKGISTNLNNLASQMSLDPSLKLETIQEFNK